MPTHAKFLRALEIALSPKHTFDLKIFQGLIDKGQQKRNKTNDRRKLGWTLKA